MKKFIILVLILSIMCIPVLNAGEYDKYKEGVHEISLDNVTNKNINNILKDIKGTIIEVEIEIKGIKKVFKVNSAITSNIEKEITKRVVKALEIDDREISVLASVHGYKINYIKLICTNEIVDIITSRTYNI